MLKNNHVITRSNKILQLKNLSTNMGMGAQFEWVGAFSINNGTKIKFIDSQASIYGIPSYVIYSICGIVFGRFCEKSVLLRD